MVERIDQWSLGPPVLVDAHAHMHNRFDPATFFAAAETNFRQAAATLGTDGSALGLLVLTVGENEWPWHRLASLDVGHDSAAWACLETREELSLLVERAGKIRLILVAGRQLRTAEALEVLALGCDRDLPEGRPLGETLLAVRDCGALPVVPWGFGKWWGRRGRLLASLLDTEPPASFFLGDNGGRPSSFPRPDTFERARCLGIRDLPGSDPLPFAGEVSRAGSRGFVLPTPLDRDTPAAGLLSRLRDPGFHPATYGPGERLLPFTVKQVGMQLRKLGRRAGS
ncbi:MAG: hypothetical protein WBH85_03420 [Thermoanaerobaculia bacterium]